MRRLVIAMLSLLVLAGPAHAESPVDTSPRPASEDPTRHEQPAPRTGSGVNPRELMRERQQAEQEGRGGRSGFWTSRQPAKGGAYRWRLLGIGLALIAITGGGILLLVRRANRANAMRQANKPTV